MVFFGNIAVSISADTKKFDKRVKKSKMTLKDFGKAVGRVTAGITGMAAVAVAAGVASLTALTKSSLEAIDTTKKFADMIGVTTEALVGLQLAASRSGVESNILNTALQRMTRRISEAGKGVGVAVGALEELQIPLESIINLSPDEQFRKITEAMGGVESQSDKVRIAMQLFDTEGVKLVNTMKAGVEGLDAANEEAKKLGLTFSGLAAKQVEQANDAMGRLGDLSRGVGNTLARELAPFIDIVANGLVDMATAGGGLGEKVSMGVNTVIRTMIDWIDMLDLVRAGWNILQAGVQVSIGKMLQPIGILAKNLENLAKLAGIDLGVGIIGDVSDALLKEGKENLAEGRKAFQDFRKGRRSGELARFVREARAESLERARLSEEDRKDPQLKKTNELLERIAENQMTLTPVAI